MREEGSRGTRVRIKEGRREREEMPSWQWMDELGKC